VTSTPTNTATPTRTPPVTATSTPAINCSPLGVASAFNLFSLGPITASNAGPGGRVAGAGNMTLSSYNIGSVLTNSNGTRDDLIGGANITFSNGQVANGNAVYVGTGTFTSVGFSHGSHRQGSVLDFTTAGTYLRNAATFWSGLATNGTITWQYNQYTLTGSNANLNIFNISGPNLAQATSVTINVPAGSTALVNVSGTNISLHNFGMTVNGTNRQNLLFNFAPATSLNLSGIAVEGSVLAPSALVSVSNGQVNGNLIAAAFNGSGQVNNYLFIGCLPSVP